MSVLIANIGTSDLSVLIDGHFYPIGFDRKERNIKSEELTDLERQIWNNREKEIALKLCPELGIKPITINNDKGEIVGYRFIFRQLTKRIWEEYQKDSLTWKKRLAVGRIGGVIEEAQNKFQVNKAYIFVTDQSTDEKPEYHPDDTCYLYKLLEEITKLQLKAIFVRDNAIDADSLLEKYYDFFSKNISDKEIVLVSIKGGTPQMQTALKMQATASGIPKLLFIDPQLNLSKALKGEYSDCAITSYWRYLKTQKYQTIQLLLNSRWDFQGSKVISEEWQNTLSFLEKHLNQDNVLQLKQEYQKLDYVNALLKQAADNLNFVSTRQSNNTIHSLLNLYAQCRIYWELEEIANVLPRLGSLYEEAVQVIIRHFSENRWFKSNNQNEDWVLIRKGNSNRTPEDIIRAYHEVENAFGERISWSDTNRLGEKKFKLGNRYRKRHFAEALIKIKGNTQQKSDYEQIMSDLKKLDFWVDKRNDLIHGTKGLTLETMEKEYEKYINSNSEERKDRYKPSTPCHYKNILGHITSVCEQLIRLTEQEAKDCVGYGKDTAYYLYSDFREQVIRKLSQ